MKIKKKKMFKSKHLFFAPFSSKTGDFFCIDGKIPKFCHKYFFKWQMWFFWWFWPKNLNCWSHNLQTFHKVKSGVVEKKPRKRKFYADSSSLWKLIFKKNKYFPLFSQQKSQIFSNIFIWNNSRPRKWEQRSSFCQIRKFQFP